VGRVEVERLVVEVDVCNEFFFYICFNKVHTITMLIESQRTALQCFKS
jgi:hypothetical protein